MMAKPRDVITIAVPAYPYYALLADDKRVWVAGEAFQWSVADPAKLKMKPIEEHPGNPITHLYLIDDELVAVGCGAGVCASPDRGKTWRVAAGAPRLQSLCLVRGPSDRFWVVGLAGYMGIAKSIDGPFEPPPWGGYLYRHLPGAMRLNHGVSFGDHLWFCGHGLFTTNGKSITRISVPTEESLTRIVPMPGGAVLVIGNKQTALRSTDHGKHWTVVKVPARGDLEDAAWLGEVLYVAGGSRQGWLLRSEDQGASFQVAAKFPRKMGAALGWRDRVLVAGDKAMFCYSP